MATIRLARPDDAAAVRDIYAPYVEQTAITFESDVPDEHDMRSRIEDISSYSTYLVCEHEGAVRAYAYGARFRTRAAYQWSTEVTVYVEQSRHRRGLGRALYTSLLECLRLQGYVVAVGVIALPNASSVALHQAFGFRELGVSRAIGFKHGAWWDVGWYELELRTPPALPQPIQTTATLAADAGRAWSRALSRGLPYVRG